MAGVRASAKPSQPIQKASLVIEPNCHTSASEQRKQAFGAERERRLRAVHRLRTHFIGRFYFSLFGSISKFVSLIIVTTRPWMLIVMIGYIQRMGFYLPDAMQAFKRGQTGGPAGSSVAGISEACLRGSISSVLALLTVNIPGHFVGSLGDIAGGVDVSLLAALILPAILYPVCLRLFPEPRAVYGPGGSRIISRSRCRSCRSAILTVPGKASAEEGARHGEHLDAGHLMSLNRITSSERIGRNEVGFWTGGVAVLNSRCTMPPACDSEAKGLSYS